MRLQSTEIPHQAGNTVRVGGGILKLGPSTSSPSIAPSPFDLAALLSSLPAPLFNSPHTLTHQSFHDQAHTSWVTDFLKSPPRSTGRSTSLPQAHLLREHMSHPSFSHGTLQLLLFTESSCKTPLHSSPTCHHLCCRARSRSQQPADDLELAHAVAFDPMPNPSEPGVQPLEEGPGSCPVVHDHNGGMWKSRLRLQEMRYDGGVRRSRCVLG